jgi:drug/metabolite transporter (DMT)-like permease
MTLPNIAAPKPWLLLFVTIAAIWGSSFVFMRVAATEFGIFPTACLRMGIGALVMLPLLAWRGLLGQMLTNWKPILLISLFTSAIPFASFAFAVLHITTGLSAILNATSPMFAALVAWLWLGQRLTALRAIGMVIAFAGVVLLAGAQAALKGDDALLSILAVLACLLAALCYGGSGNVVKERLPHLHPWVIAGGTMLGATLWLAVPCLLTLPAANPSAKAWSAVLVAAVLCSALAFMLYFELMLRVDIALTSSVTYLITVFALFYGALFLDEHITLWLLLCGAVVLVGTALATGLMRKQAFGCPYAIGEMSARADKGVLCVLGQQPPWLNGK